jgi:hypothetical protein
MAMMVSLQRRLDNFSDGDQERQFFSHALRYLITASGRQVEMESWMITSYEVEFGRRIGSGGLCVLLLSSLFCLLRTDFESTTAGRCSWGHGITPKLLSRF